MNYAVKATANKVPEAPRPAPLSPLEPAISIAPKAVAVATPASPALKPDANAIRRFVLKPPQKWEQTFSHFCQTSAEIVPFPHGSPISLVQKGAFAGKTTLPWRKFEHVQVGPLDARMLIAITSADGLVFGSPESICEMKGDTIAGHNYGRSPGYYTRTGDSGRASVLKSYVVWEWYERTIREAEQGYPPTPLALRPRIVDDQPEEPTPDLGDWPDADGMVWVITSRSRRKLPPSRFLLAPPLRALPKPSVVEG